LFSQQGGVASGIVEGAVYHIWD
jgi:hypothetical protein